MDEISAHFPSDTKPLENVLEHYGGNEDKMRKEQTMEEIADFPDSGHRRPAYIVPRAYQ